MKKYALYFAFYATIFCFITQEVAAQKQIAFPGAEGYGRFHYKDNAKFCSNARGSLYEVIDHLITALDEDLIQNELYLTRPHPFVHVLFPKDH